MLDADRRKEIILADARNLAFARGLELVEDEALLEEVAGLVEWPVVLVGSSTRSSWPSRPRWSAPPSAPTRSASCCAIPPPGALSNHFILVSNIEASDGGEKIVAGNERVVRARLSDARHFWETDQATLPDYAGQRRQAAGPAARQAEEARHRLPRKARHAGRARGAHRRAGARARAARRRGPRPRRPRGRARQGRPRHRDGRRIPRGRRASWAAATPSCKASIPASPPRSRNTTSRRARATACRPTRSRVAVALADKLDTLVGFWAIDEKPTGSKDPYALRRAALGVVRLIGK